MDVIESPLYRIYQKVIAFCNTGTLLRVNIDLVRSHICRTGNEILDWSYIESEQNEAIKFL